MKNKLFPIALFMSAFLAGFDMYASEVKLKNGGTFTGDIASENNNFLILNINGSKVNILKQTIVSIDGKPYQASSPQASSPQASSPQASSPQASSPQASSPQASSPQASSPQASSPQASSPQAPSPQAPSPQAPSPQAPSPQAPSPETQTSDIKAGSDVSVKLKNGTSLTGKIVSLNERLIVIENVGSKTNIFRAVIETIVLVGKAATTPKVPAAAPANKPAISAPATSAVSRNAVSSSGTAISSKEQASSPKSNTEASAAQPTAPISAKLSPAPESHRQSAPTQQSSPQLPPKSTISQHLPSSPKVTVIGAEPQKSASSDSANRVPPKPKKRRDGKTEITLKNGTGFVGKVVSENALFMVFSSEGATINLLKRLIKEIDGVPFKPDTSISLALRDTLLYRPQATAREPVSTAAADSARRQAAFQRGPAPKVSIREGVTAAELADSLKSSSWQHRSNAARQLGAMGQWASSAIPALVDILDDTTQCARMSVLNDQIDPDLLLAPAFESARSLSRMGSSGFEALKGALRDPNPAARKCACFGIGEVADSKVLPLLVAAFKDREPEVRAAAVAAMRFEGATEHLVQALNDVDPDVRFNAAILLGQIGDVRAVKPLAGALYDKRTPVRNRAAQSLGKIGKPESLGPLLTALGDGNSFVRESAARALGIAKDTAAVGPLITALKDNSPEIRLAAAEALSCMRDPRAIPSLYSLLKDNARAVREVAEQSLKLHTDILLLIAALTDPSPVVRDNVAYVLWLLTGKEFGLNKEQWLAWQESENAPAKKQGHKDKHGEKLSREKKETGEKKAETK